MEAKIDNPAEIPVATHCTLYVRGDVHISGKGDFVENVLKSGKMPTGLMQIEFFPEEEILVIRKLTVHELPANL